MRAKGSWMNSLCGLLIVEIPQISLYIKLSLSAATRTRSGWPVTYGRVRVYMRGTERAPASLYAHKPSLLFVRVYDNARSPPESSTRARKKGGKTTKKKRRRTHAWRKLDTVLRTVRVRSRRFVDSGTSPIVTTESENRDSLLSLLLAHSAPSRIRVRLLSYDFDAASTVLSYAINLNTCVQFTRIKTMLRT